MIKRAKHPNGSTVEFSEGDHRYIIVETEQVLTSVTTFIGDYFPKFDAEAVAKKCVGKPKYIGKTANEIRQVWEQEAERGRREGTNTHWYAECLLLGNRLPAPESLREQNLFNQTAVTILGLEERFVFVATEYIVFSPTLGIAGTIDLIMHDPQTNDLILLDWKQNKEISRKNPWENALPPINHWESTDLNKYKLQLNIYEKIILSEGYCGFANIPKATGVRKALIHLKETSYSVIKISDCQKEVEMIMEIPF